MTFTDDHLKRVKRDLPGFRSWASDEEVLALIARLEAAEKVAMEARYCQEEKFFSDELSDYYQAWRKKAGK